MNTKNTIILFWNPEVSNFKTDAYQELLESIEHAPMNWSIHEHEKAHFGDRFSWCAVEGRVPASV